GTPLVAQRARGVVAGRSRERRRGPLLVPRGRGSPYRDIRGPV
ncbi:MAG: hypothetical protein AVDCRST_MAG28-3033, partial [uncultured Rubrobacteraceae bacterium]